MDKKKEEEVLDVFKQLGIPPKDLQDYRNIEEFTKSLERCSAPQETSYVYTTFSLNEKREIL